jgi:hypothetical protein
MTEYKIERFDAILNGGTSNTKLPIIYIKPDSEFLEFAKKNNYIVGCKIKNSRTIYDDKVLVGLLNTNFLKRPNFFNKTGLCTLTLLVQWNGYPEYGLESTVTFFGVNEENNNNETFSNTEKPQHSLKEKKSGFSEKEIIKIISPTLAFLVLLLIVYFLKNAESS